MAYGTRPVPQNIMSVEFKLFDFMTLKQFIYGFVLVLISGALFYFIQGPWRIVLPLFLMIGGIVVIFVPFNGEPFSEFISSYLEALILPQRRVWHRKGFIVKTAMQKARMYRYGDEAENEGENSFKYLENASQQKTEVQTALDTEEQKFLAKKLEDVGAGKTSASPQSTTISPKSVQNSYDIGKLSDNQQQQESAKEPHQAESNANTETQQLSQDPMSNQNDQKPNVEQSVDQLNQIIAPNK